MFFLSDRIKYLTMTDATKVWMPDTFFRWVQKQFNIQKSMLKNPTFKNQRSKINDHKFMFKNQC